MPIKFTFKYMIPIMLLFTWGCTQQSHLQNKGIQRAEERRATLNTILENPILSQCTVGINVVRLSDNQVIFSKNEDKLLHPASTMKLFTTALALEHLGGAYQYTTQLATTDTVEPDIKELYIIGTGDPSLTSGDIAHLARQLKQQSIQTIDSIICDATLLDDIQYGHGWMWDDQPYKDFAPISALSVNMNFIEIQLSPATRKGKQVKVRTIPTTSFIAIKNNAITTGGNNNALHVARDIQENKNTLTISGTQGLNNETQIMLRNIERPALYAGTILKEECQKLGIRVNNVPRLGMAPENVQAIALHQSLPLAQLIMHMNKESLNIYAELLLKTVASHNAEQQGSAEQGLVLLETLLEEWNIPKTGYAFADGSGVSRYNLVTPKTLTDLLTHIYNDDNKKNDFSHSLPIGGFDGDLDWRMENLSSKQNIKAKTGYLRGVSTLAGFITTDSGETLAFSMMMEHFNGSALPFLQIQDQLCEQLSRF